MSASLSPRVGAALFASAFAFARALAVFALVVASATFARPLSAAPEAALDFARPLDRATCLRAAVARSPALRAARHRARAADEEAAAAGRLPDPEVTVDLWQVPLARPYAVGESQMAMFGARQSIPPPGLPSAQRDARREDARAERLEADDVSREVAREADHAFADYVEAAARHHVHREHARASEQILAIARARFESGGSIDAVAQAELYLRRVEVDVIADASFFAGARARLNTLLVRPADAPLGDPIAGEPMTIGLDVAALDARGRRERPDVRALEARGEAASHDLRAASREATWPAFGVGLLYFAPTSQMPRHGYGTSLAMSLPWLWGGSNARRRAAAARADASRGEVEGARARVSLDVVTAVAAARREGDRLLALRDLARPAATRAIDAALAGYESGRTDVVAVLLAERGVIETAMELVMARAALDHALADLDWAVGGAVPRAPLRPRAGGHDPAPLASPTSAP